MSTRFLNDAPLLAHNFKYASRWNVPLHTTGYRIYSDCSRGCLFWVQYFRHQERKHLGTSIQVTTSTCMTNFDVLLTLHLSIFISVISELDAQHFCFTIIFFSCLYMFGAHVLETCRGKK